MADELKCTSGNYQCGGRCLSNKYKCINELDLDISQLATKFAGTIKTAAQAQKFAKEQLGGDAMATKAQLEKDSADLGLSIEEKAFRHVAWWKAQQEHLANSVEQPAKVPAEALAKLGEHIAKLNEAKMQEAKPDVEAMKKQFEGNEAYLPSDEAISQLIAEHGKDSAYSKVRDHIQKESSIQNMAKIYGQFPSLADSAASQLGLTRPEGMPDADWHNAVARSKEDDDFNKLVAYNNSPEGKKAWSDKYWTNPMEQKQQRGISFKPTKADEGNDAKAFADQLAADPKLKQFVSGIASGKSDKQVREEAGLSQEESIQLAGKIRQTLGTKPGQTIKDRLAEVYKPAEENTSKLEADIAKAKAKYDALIGKKNMAQEKRKAKGERQESQQEAKLRSDAAIAHRQLANLQSQLEQTKPAQPTEQNEPTADDYIKQSASELRQKYDATFANGSDKDKAQLKFALESTSPKLDGESESDWLDRTALAVAKKINTPEYIAQQEKDAKHKAKVQGWMNQRVIGGGKRRLGGL